MIPHLLFAAMTFVFRFQFGKQVQSAAESRLGDRNGGIIGRAARVLNDERIVGHSEKSAPARPAIIPFPNAHKARQIELGIPQFVGS
jgi:hypothetical protein